jgi:hypothetical protein
MGLTAESLIGVALFVVTNRIEPGRVDSVMALL